MRYFLPLILVFVFAADIGEGCTWSFASFNWLNNNCCVIATTVIASEANDTAPCLPCQVYMKLELSGPPPAGCRIGVIVDDYLLGGSGGWTAPPSTIAITSYADCGAGKTVEIATDSDGDNRDDCILYTFSGICETCFGG